MRSLTIAGRTLSDDRPPLVIAELGNNHQGRLDTALMLIRAAARAGAGAVKFQVRHNATLYSSALLAQPYDHEHSFGRTYGEHRAALELSSQALSACFMEATRLGLIGFATAFDERSADQLWALGVPAIKLASGALTDTALQTYVAQMRIPLVLSTGGGTEADIDRAVQTVTAVHGKLALLHCVASYPQAPADANLRCIGTLRQRYPTLVIGYSSHSPGIMVSLVAYAFGASILEQHVTLDRSMKGTDHAFSLEPKGLETLCEDLGKLQLSLGDGVKRFLEVERKPIAKMRRRLTADGWQITGALDAAD